MAKKSSNNAHADGHFSPKALFELKKKETELQLSSYSFCKKPYKMLDYSPFIYMDILKALNKQFCKKYEPVKIKESTITESSEYINSANCVIFPVFVRGQMFVFIEPYDYNKATYGLKIDKTKFFQIIDKLKVFFSSATINKRSSFPEFVKPIEGVIAFKRFAHTTSKVWEQRIMEFIKLSPTI